MAGKKGVREEVKVSEKDKSRFSKEQLLSSEHFRERRDIVKALLDPGGLYTMEDVEKKIRNYMEGKVK